MTKVMVVMSGRQTRGVLIKTPEAPYTQPATASKPYSRCLRSGRLLISTIRKGVLQTLYYVTLYLNPVNSPCDEPGECFKDMASGGKFRDLV